MLTLAYAAQVDLWNRLQALDLDGTAQLSFSRRLARDNGWPLAFAQRTVLEYKKFVFLAATCGHPVTPSDEVDQAWHLHLVYTRSYWDELCGQVLGFALHHGPTQGGAAEGHKFQEWYGQTLRAYQAAFGVLPPADIRQRVRQQAPGRGADARYSADTVGLLVALFGVGELGALGLPELRTRLAPPASAGSDGGFGGGDSGGSDGGGGDSGCGGCGGCGGGGD